MTFELYDDGRHSCRVFHDLVQGAGVQANQFLLRHGSNAALIDPGGELTVASLMVSVDRLRDGPDPASLEYLIATHQDPDVLSSMGRWLEMTDAKLVVPSIWSRFVYHACKANRAIGRLLPVPDEGMVLPFEETELILLPAHFLHSPGNFQVYDPTSRILFSGDLGAWTGEDFEYRPVEDFAEHARGLGDFHRRYMAGGNVCRLWAGMVRQLDIAMIVPQHGPPLCGQEMVTQFIDWVESAECGIDVMSEQNYRLPFDP